MANYTPDGNFNFVADPSYTPDGNFNFNTTPTIDPVGYLSATLDDVVGSFDAQLIITATLSATLDDVAGSFDGYIELRGELVATLDDATANFIAENVANQAVFNVTLDDAVGGMICEYDPNVHRFTTAKTAIVIEEATQLSPVKVEAPSQQSTRTLLFANTHFNQQNGTLLFANTHFNQQNGTIITTTICADFVDATWLTNKTGFVQQQGTFIERILCADTDSATPVITGVCAIAQQMTKVYPDKWQVVLQDSANTQFDFLHTVYPDSGDIYTPDGDFNFTNESYTPDGDFNFTHRTHDYNAVGHNLGVVRSGVYSSFQPATYFDKKLCSIIEQTKQPDRGVTAWVDLDPTPIDPNPPSGVTITVPVQEVYTMQNTISVTLDDGTTAIQLGDISLSLDADSTAWTFNAKMLDPAEKPLITHLADGSAITLYVTINTYVWHVLVEKIVTNRTFGEDSISISGRGISSLLSKPYQQPASVNVGALQTIQQIADSILPAGWTNTWSTVTWNVDAGAYSYNTKTPLEALSDLARDIGAVVVPSPDSQVLEFKPRYPVAPWDFATPAVDVAIPDSAIVALTEEPVSNFQGDGIYIHGLEIGGEIAFCRRNGSAGTKLMPTVSNALMTDVVGIRALAERHLAAQAPQPAIKSITTFMDATTVPFVNIGTFIGITVDAVEIRGIVNAVSIETTHTTVAQTLTIGESTPNTWAAFKKILPQRPLLIATMTSTDGATSLMQLVDGGIVRVTGTGVPTQKYYIREGAIKGDAPTATLLTDIVVPV